MRCPFVANNWVSFFFQMHRKPIANFTRHGYGNLLIYTLIIYFYRHFHSPSHDRTGQSPVPGRSIPFYTYLLVHFLTPFFRVSENFLWALMSEGRDKPEKSL